jgi:hypothetical protein
MTAKITLEWTEFKDGFRALVFDPKTWAAFEKAAQAQGKSAHQIIVTAVAGSLGTVVMDNYKLNRWLKNDDPDFSASDVEAADPHFRPSGDSAAFSL